MTDAFIDANNINNLAASFESAGGTVVIETTAPPSNEVILPGGFVLADGSLVKYAEIRELNGADEEALAKANSPGKSLRVILSRGLVKIGDEPATSKDLDTLLAGDQEAILIGIRVATFGKDLKFSGVCPTCSNPQSFVVDLEADIEMVSLDDPFNDRVFSIDAKIGKVVLSLPNGVTTKKLTEAESENKSFAELVTILLSGCIVSVNEQPSMGISTALKLGISDRELLVNELYKRAPGPRLGGVTKTCKACDNEISLALGLADLFRL
jgi:hypothetical protein